MNAALLQQHLSGNSDALFRILETLEFQHINLNNAKTQFRFSRLEDSNPTSMMLDVNTLRYYCFSTNGKGNLFTLIMDRIHCTFPQSLQFVANILDLDTSDFNVQVTYPFHGFYRKLLPDRDDDFTLPTIPENTLDPYLGKFNTMFFQDGMTPTESSSRKPPLRKILSTKTAFITLTALIIRLPSLLLRTFQLPAS